MSSRVSVGEFSGGARFSSKLGAAIGKRPFVICPRFVRYLGRRNCSNVRIVASSSSDNRPLSFSPEDVELIKCLKEKRRDVTLNTRNVEEKIRKSRTFFETLLSGRGITATVIDPADYTGLESALDNHKVSLFFTESPTDPFLRCVDIESVSKLCRSKGAIVCIDGTSAAPFHHKALALGADIVVHSLTEYIGWNIDVLAGYVSGSTELVSQVRNSSTFYVETVCPSVSFILSRGMKTLKLRVRQQDYTAQRMARVLEAHPKVKHVYYPGLQSHPDHHLAKKQMIGFGGIVSFEVDGDSVTTRKFVDALKIPYSAESFGGCASIVNQPALMSPLDLSQSDMVIMDNLVRFSFGVEDYEDLEADVLQALEVV